MSAWVCQGTGLPTHLTHRSRNGSDLVLVAVPTEHLLPDGRVDKGLGRYL